MIRLAASASGLRLGPVGSLRLASTSHCSEATARRLDPFPEAVPVAPDAPSATFLVRVFCDRQPGTLPDTKLHWTNPGLAV